MAFTDNIKEITPAITQLKSNTPVIVIDGKIYVAGIGGNFIPGNAAASQSGTANIAAGYITISDSVITVHNVTDGTTSTTDKLYIADTGVEDPDYQSGGGSVTPAPTGSGLIYGVIYDPSNSSPVCQRVIKDGNTLRGVAGFPYMPAHNWKRCVMDDLQNRHVNYYLSPFDSNYKQDGVTPSVLTGADGDVMVQIPVTYWSVTTTSDSKVLYLVSDQPFTGSQPHPFFYVSPGGQTLRKQYVGAYDACICDASGNPLDISNQNASSSSSYSSGYKIRSLKGAKPFVKSTRATARTAAEANGGHLVNALFNQYLILMAMIEGGSLNTQTAISTGYSFASAFEYSWSRFSGRCNFGNGTGNLYADPVQDSSISWASGLNPQFQIVQFQYRGIENAWGHVNKITDGFVKDDNGYYMTKDCSAYSDNDYVNSYTWESHVWPTNSGYIQTFDPRTFLPVSVGGSDTTYLPDYFYPSSGAAWISYGGHLGNAGYAGASYVDSAGFQYTAYNEGFRISA